MTAARAAPDDVVVVGAVRTPVGRAAKGSLASVRPDDLGALVVAALLERTGLDPSLVDDHVLGCGYPEGEQGYNLGRRVGLLAGLPDTVPGSTTSRFCGSSLQATREGFHALRAGEASFVVASGVESASRVGRTLVDADRHPRLAPGAVADVYVPMGITAENVARRCGVRRVDMDALALRSHRLAVRAQDSGFFREEIVPVTLPDGSVVDRDDSPRRTTSAEALASLPPAFVEGGSVTAGNSCPLSDGAAAVLLATGEAAARAGLAARARVLATSVSAIAPELMGLGPIDAISDVLRRARLTIRDVDVVELNEAFAAQVIPVCDATGIDVEAQLNPHGGAIALGHPFGMTGARLVCTLVHALEARDGRIGLVALCVGGGQGMAAVLERLG
ncbi:MAG: thiolase family protein [Actinomycetota bacterium]|nr:thiolase family protein [Actinomycetota bacterium]